MSLAPLIFLFPSSPRLAAALASSVLILSNQASCLVDKTRSQPDGPAYALPISVSPSAIRSPTELDTRTSNQTMHSPTFR